MYFCSDCHLPASLDDAVTLFRDGTCICLTCHRRGETVAALPEGLRRDLEALLAGLDAA